MNFLNQKQLVELASLVTAADQMTRLNLTRGLIRDENDYTSNFTGTHRALIASNARSGLSAQSFLLPTREEREIGADAAIILSNGRESKVSVFEAKWPRFGTPGYEWDSKQKLTGKSHFSDQLERQKKWSPQLAVFEMFYNECPSQGQPTFLLPKGSSCVWHDDAQEFRDSRFSPDALWTQRDLEKLLRKNQVELSKIMIEFGRCNKGSPIRMLDPMTIAQEFDLPPIILSIVAKAEQNEQPRVMGGF